MNISEAFRATIPTCCILGRLQAKTKKDDAQNGDPNRQKWL